MDGRVDINRVSFPPKVSVVRVHQASPVSMALLCIYRTLLTISALLCASTSAFAVHYDAMGHELISFASGVKRLHPSLVARSSPTSTASPEDTICNYEASYPDLTTLNLAIAYSQGASNPLFTPNLFDNGTMRTDCISYYKLGALINMLDAAYKNYTIVNQGYNEQFDHYVDYMRATVPEIIKESFMFDDAKGTSAMPIPPVGPGMQYFDCKTEDSGSSYPCTDISNVTMPGKAGYHPTTLTLRPGMEDKYHTALTNAGISPDWIEFGAETITWDEVDGRGGRRWQYQFKGFPVAKPNFNVSNPKDIVTKALPHIPHLQQQMLGAQMMMMLGIYYNGSIDDAAKAYSIPVFLLIQAVENMAQAKALGIKEEKMKEEEKGNMIVLILSVVLLFVPFAGEAAASAAGLADLATGIAILGEVANGALSIYDSVKDPSSAVINILGMLLGLGGISKVASDGPGLAKVAKLEGDISETTMKALGSLVSENADTLKTVSKFCKL